MLSFDMAGRLIAPSRMAKTFGGNIDSRGIPDDIEIPTTGAQAGVVISDYSDPWMAKTLTRTVAGKATIQGPSITLKGDMVAVCVKVRAFGGGSSATSGSTRRDFSYGLRSDDGQHGLFKEYRNPDRTETGNFITGRAAGVDTRRAINYQDNNPAERYPPEFWVSRNVLTGGWTAYLFEGDQCRTVMNVPATDATLTTFRPFIEWDWTYPTGNFNVNIAHFSTDIYWRF